MNIDSYNFTESRYEFFDVNAVLLDRFFLPDSYLVKPAGGYTEGIKIQEDQAKHYRFISLAELSNMGFASIALFITQFDIDKALTTTGAGAAGATTQVQFNNAGSFGASANLTFDDTTEILKVSGKLGIKSPGGAIATPNIVIGATANLVPLMVAAGAISNIIIGRDIGDLALAGDRTTIIGSYNFQDPSTLGIRNTCIGTGNFIEPSTVGNYNTVIGSGNCYNGIYGDRNVIIGTSNWSQNSLTGATNVCIGNGNSSTTGSSNVMIGDGIGYDALNGVRNILMGKQIGQYGSPTGNDNIAMGFRCSMGYGDGSHVLSGSRNIMMGQYVCRYGLTGNSNIVMGDKAVGYEYGYTTSGSNNIIMGLKTCYNLNGNASNNIVMGASSGYNLTSGNLNVFMGRESGNAATTTSNSVFIGAYSGDSVTTVANQLHVGSLSGRTLIGGDFLTGIATIERGGVILPVTAIVASALTPQEGLEVNVSSTDATFTSTGKWIYEGAAWKKFTVV